MRMACTLACSGGQPPPGGSRRVQGSASLLSSRGHRTCAVSVVWNSRARRTPHRADGLGPQRHGDTWTLPAAPGAKQQVLQREPLRPLEEAPPGRRYAPQCTAAPLTTARPGHSACPPGTSGYTAVVHALHGHHAVEKELSPCRIAGGPWRVTLSGRASGRKTSIIPSHSHGI